MLSVSTVSAGAAASGYYKEEGYYQAGTPEARDVALWFGKAAADLGLTGRVDDDKFTAFLEGETPDGRLMGRIRDGEREHRPGVDLTFSASKTASIAALVLGDTRVVEAHDKAVRAAMSVVEDRFVSTRWYENGQEQRGRAAGIIAGIYRHDTSRALDPQLHSHAVITNMVRNDAGGYTALRNEDLFRNRKLITEIYRSEFERELNDHGIKTERGRYGEVNVSAVPKELADAFSTRRQEILDALNRKGLEATPENAARATLATRAVKHKDVDREALRSGWALDVREAGFDLAALQAAIGRTQAPPLRIPEDQVRPRSELRGETGMLGRIQAILGLGEDAVRDRTLAVGQGPREAVSKAVEHLSERSTTYSRAELTVAAMAFSRDGRFADVDREIDQRLEKGGLLTSDPDGHVLTDKASVAMEQEILASWRKAERASGLSIGRAAGRTPERTLERALDRARSLTDGQRDAITTALTGAGRYVGVQGYAGTGKTFMLDRLAHYAGQSGYEVKAYAPSHQAVKELGQVVGTAQTLQSLLIAERTHPQVIDNSKTILVVDEASMVGTQDMRDLMAHADRTGAARGVMSGDTKQLDAVAAGQPFDLLQKSGMRVAVMDEIRRQENPELRAAVYQTIRGEIRAAFETLSKSVVQSEDYLSDAAGRYLSMSPEDRDGTRVLTTTNAARAELNDAIRAGLRAEGTIGSDAVQIAGLVNRNLTGAERSDARFYQAGDTIQATATSAEHGLRKGQLYEVAAIDTDKNKLTVRGQGADEPLMLPLDASLRQRELGRSLTVYETETRGMAPGDLVRFRMTDPGMGVTNGELGQLVAAPDGALAVRTRDSEIRALDPQSPGARGMEHNYAVTAHAAQGESVDQVIVAMRSSEQLATQKSFYVDISRARETATLFTDDAERLARTVERETGEQQHALSQAGQELEKTAIGDEGRDPGAEKDRDEKYRRDAGKGHDDGDKPDQKPELTEDDVMQRIQEAENRAEKILTREKEITR